MEWTNELIESFQHLLPTQRGNVKIGYLDFFQALQYITENGCKWRTLPKKHGTAYTEAGRASTSEDRQSKTQETH
jgi:hypothetical protein